VGAETERVVFFLFHVDPVGDEVFVEDVAAQQEGMFSRVQRSRVFEIARVFVRFNQVAGCIVNANHGVM
jgi:hypothetical protein